jgi:hypothetical protein
MPGDRKRGRSSFPGPNGRHGGRPLRNAFASIFPKRKRAASPFLLALLCVPVLAAQPAAPSTTPAAQEASATARPAGITPAAPVAKAPNPHWSRTGCQHCHVLAGEQARPIPVQKIEGICVKCHDGRRAPAEPHPVGRPFGGMTSPPGWPAPDNTLTCITCHDVHPNQDYYAPRPPQNPMFLRGYTGSLRAFCGQCHPGSTAPEHRYNPHVVQVENGQVVEKSCAFCHTKPLPSGAQAVRTGQPALRADPISLCIGCHRSHPEWSPRSHIGAKIRPRNLAAMNAFAAAHGLTPPDARPAAGFLPLAGGNTLMCATCHNPHEQGVFPPGSPLAAGAVQPDHLVPQLRGLRSNLCGACHGT